MRLSFCLSICLLQIFYNVEANVDKYVIIAPGCIFSNQTYTAAVAVHYTSQPCQIRVSITGPVYNETKQVVVSSNEVKNVEFDVPDLENGNGSYNLTAEGINCLDNFKNVTEIFHYSFKNSDFVKIQTDKGLYKSGDDVYFRVLFMDTELKPTEPIKDLMVWISDSKHNKIEIKNFTTNMGVHTGKFRIPENATAGTWAVRVDNGGFYGFGASFKVDDIRSRYVVEVEATDSVSVKDGDMQVVVTANYVSGEPLIGNVTVNISLKYFIFSEPPTLVKTAKIVNGKAIIDFDVKDAYLPFITSKTEMNITATIEEQYTGTKIKAYTGSYIYPFRYTMICTRPTGDSCHSFEADEETDVHFQVIHINGSYVNDTKSPIEFTYEEQLNSGKFSTRRTHAMSNQIKVFHFKKFMNETGFVTLKLNLPKLDEYEGYLHYYSLKYKYKDEERYILYTYQNRKSRDYFILQDQSSNNKLHLNKAHLFTVKSSQPFSYIIYNIVGRRNILKSVHIDLSDKPKVYNFTLTPELSWAPEFKVYVYFVDENGDYHYDEKKYSTFEQLNPITVTAPKKVNPGDEVTLTIQTTPNSFVGLMAVNQKLLLLNKNNELLPSTLADIWDIYSTFAIHLGGYSRYPGKLVGCVTLTNANYFYSWKPISRLPNLGLNANGGVYRRRQNIGKEDDASYEQIGEDTWKPWIFDNIVNTTAPEFTWSKKIPETNTTWVLTAFSFNPSKGLGVAEQIIKIKASKTLT